jgi:hypothetical protein
MTSILDLLPVPNDQLAKITHDVRVPFVRKWPKPYCLGVCWTMCPLEYESRA